MKTDPTRSELLDALFSNVASSEFRDQTLNHTLATVRQQRNRRQQRRMALIASLPVLLLGLCLVYLLPLGSLSTVQESQLPVTTPEPVTIAGTSIRVLTDEDLFKLFPDRPVAMVKKGTETQLVFLDELDR